MTKLCDGARNTWFWNPIYYWLQWRLRLHHQCLGDTECTFQLPVNVIGTIETSAIKGNAAFRPDPLREEAEGRINTQCKFRWDLHIFSMLFSSVFHLLFTTKSLAGRGQREWYHILIRTDWKLIQPYYWQTLVNSILYLQNFFWL